MNRHERGPATAPTVTRPQKNRSSAVSPRDDYLLISISDVRSVVADAVLILLITAYLALACFLILLGTAGAICAVGAFAALLVFVAVVSGGQS